MDVTEILRDALDDTAWCYRDFSDKSSTTRLRDALDDIRRGDDMEGKLYSVSGMKVRRRCKRHLSHSSAGAMRRKPCIRRR